MTTGGRDDLLRVEQLSVAYGPIMAVDGINFGVPEGAVISLIGANGAGKTTTLLAVSGVLRARAGRIYLGGRDITRWPPHRIVEAGVAHVPEGRAMLAQMTVQENLEMGGYRRKDRQRLARDVAAMMERFPILEQRRHLPAGSLSGGEQQILAIARGLLAEPKILLLDEPSMGLAPQRVEEVFAMLREIHAAGTTILLVEQNARKALAMSDYAYVLETGRITLEGPGAALLENPAVAEVYLGRRVVPAGRQASEPSTEQA